MLLSIFKPLIITIILESFIVAIINKSLYSVLISVLCNVLTNPAANLTFAAFTRDLDYFKSWILLIAVELTVVLTEAWLYIMLINGSRKRLLFTSLAANLFSFAVGLMLYPDFFR